MLFYHLLLDDFFFNDRGSAYFLFDHSLCHDLISSFLYVIMIINQIRYFLFEFELRHNLSHYRQVKRLGLDAVRTSKHSLLNQCLVSLARETNDLCNCRVCWRMFPYKIYDIKVALRSFIKVRYNEPVVTSELHRSVYRSDCLMIVECEVY